jgi:DNA-binding transcriptional LysR family regulator
MDLVLLTIFIQVVRRGSFAAVARERETDASSISRAVAALEKELGFRLFQRTTRTLVLTEAGAAYYERVVPLMEGLESAQSAAAELSEIARGTLRITASVSFGQKILVPQLAQFMQLYPEIALEMILTDATLDLLAERIDLAVRLGTLPDSGLIAQELFNAVYRVCASPHYVAQHGRPAVPEELRHRECLRLPYKGFKTTWIFQQQNGPRHEIPVGGRVLISNALAVEQCARSGMGVALLPHWIVDDAIAAGDLVDLFPHYRVTATTFDAAAWLVYPTRVHIPLKVRVFVDFLRRIAVHKTDPVLAARFVHPAHKSLAS